MKPWGRLTAPRMLHHPEVIDDVRNEAADCAKLPLAAVNRAAAPHFGSGRAGSVICRPAPSVR